MKNDNFSLVGPSGSETLADIIEKNRERLVIEKLEQGKSLQKKKNDLNIQKLKEKIADIKSAHAGYISQYNESTIDLAKSLYGFANGQINQLGDAERKELHSKLRSFCIRRRIMWYTTLSCIETILLFAIYFIDPRIPPLEILLALLLVHIFPLILPISAVEEKISHEGNTRKYLRGTKHLENKCKCTNKIVLKEKKLKPINQTIPDQ